MTNSTPTLIRGYADCSWIEKAQILVFMIQTPVVLVWAVLTYPFKNTSDSDALRSKKTLTRTLGKRFVRNITDSLSSRQLQFMLGLSTREVIEKWCKSNSIPMLEEKVLGGTTDSSLFWIGEKRKDRVVLYLHGGGFLFPAQDISLSFWNEVREKLKAGGKDVGVVMFNYTLVPNGIFPVQLKQACSAIEHILASGVEPKNLQIVGDSAGANLILQVISHILHPLEDVAPLSPLSTPIRGIYMMSPWVSLTFDSREHSATNRTDTISGTTLGKWGSEVLRAVPPSSMPYIHPKSAPEGWFEGIQKVVERVLITAGAAESMRDDIIDFERRMNGFHTKVDLVLQPGGVHDDPFYDSAWGGSEGGRYQMGLIVQWLADGFSDY